MRYALIAFISAVLISPLTGCDKKVSEKQDTSHNPITGSTTTDNKTTYQRPDGSTYTNSEEHTSK